MKNHFSCMKNEYDEEKQQYKSTVDTDALLACFPNPVLDPGPYAIGQTLKPEYRKSFAGFPVDTEEFKWDVYTVENKICDIIKDGSDELELTADCGGKQYEFHLGYTTEHEEAAFISVHSGLAVVMQDEKFKVYTDVNGGYGETHIWIYQSGSEYKLPECELASLDGTVFDYWEVTFDGAEEPLRMVPGETIHVVAATTLKAMWTEYIPNRLFYDPGTVTWEQRGWYAPTLTAPVRSAWVDERYVIKVQPEKK